MDGLSNPCARKRLPCGELNKQNITSLSEACFQNQVDCAEKLLNSGADVNAIIDYRTALCDACEVGSIACTELLCKMGADVNPQPKCWSPLHIACLNKHVQCAEILLKYGAHVNSVHYYNRHGTPLFAACSAGSFSCTELLLKMGADVNPPNTLFSPLHIAYQKIASLLINAGANLNAGTHLDAYLNCSCEMDFIVYLGTPLHTASFLNRRVCLKLLLQAGALVEGTMKRPDDQNKLPIDLLKRKKGGFYDLLEQSSVQPVLLKDLCRRKIRGTLGSQRLKFLPDLNMPKSLVSYLMHIS
ncbi:ankyrin repeat and SOCS box protein 13 [Caerostris extrusa]|uniref:Ankyrin repeat and SOCS box protein 13 n=1 Tax=Caerostris extrusa TaxID=172846 RepID=A0AAV4PJ69_CAEEX|nr:ankyrin repeat and SOCS box protein 13 [Caerostris extrusa]